MRKFDFQLKLDQSFIHTIEDQSKWIINKKGLNSQMPNFLVYIYSDALEKVSPENMLLIK